MRTLLFFLFAGVLAAQSPVAPSVTPATPPAGGMGSLYPSYFVSAGGGYTRNAAPNAAEGWVSAAIQLGAASTYYSITTVDMTSKASTIRTGFGKIFKQSGNFTLMGRMDAGISTVTPTIGSFSGGAILLYNLKGFSPKLADVFLLGEFRISAVSSPTAAIPNAVTPGFYFGVGKSF